MSGIEIPRTRTKRQRGTGYCYNPACREISTDERFEFPVEDTLFACPRCGNNKGPGTGLLNMTHWLQSDQKGKIEGSAGSRWQIACDPERAFMTDGMDKEAGSNYPGVVNCPGCLKILAAKPEITLPPLRATH